MCFIKTFYFFRKPFGGAGVRHRRGAIPRRVCRTAERQISRWWIWRSACQKGGRGLAGHSTDICPRHSRFAYVRRACRKFNAMKEKWGDDVVIPWRIHPVPHAGFQGAGRHEREGKLWLVALSLIVSGLSPSFVFPKRLLRTYPVPCGVMIECWLRVF